MPTNPRNLPQKGRENFSLSPFLLGVVFIISEYLYIAKKIDANISNIFLAVVPAAIVLFALKWFAKPEMIGFRFLNLGFLYGAAPTIALATLGSLILTYLPIPGYVIAGFVEEGVKALFIIFLLKKWSFRYRSVEVMFLGMAIGGGFAFTENMMYFMQPSDKYHLGLMFLGRGIITPFAHPLFTAVLGYYIGLAYSDQRVAQKKALIFKGYLYASLLHSAFDWSTKYLSAMTLSVSILTLVGVEGFLSRNRARENKIINAKLAKYTVALKPVERDWLTSLTQRREYQKLLSKAERGAFNRWIQLWRELLLEPSFSTESDLQYTSLLTTELRKEWEPKYLTDKYLVLPKINLEDYIEFIKKFEFILSTYIDLKPEYLLIQKIKDEENAISSSEVMLEELSLKGDQPRDIDPYGLDEETFKSESGAPDNSNGEFRDKYTLDYDESRRTEGYLNLEELKPKVEKDSMGNLGYSECDEGFNSDKSNSSDEDKDGGLGEKNEE